MTSYVLTYRLVKGSAITAAEHDGSLHNLDDRTTVLEGTAAGLASVTGAEVDTNGHLIITLSNSDTIDAGDLTNLPPNFADLLIGPWPVSTQVYKNQLFTATGRLFVVNVDHITASTFDRYASGGGHDYYSLVLDYVSIPGITVSDATFSPTVDHVGVYIRLTTTETAGCAVTIDPSLDWGDWADLNFRDETTAGTTYSITSTTAEPATINPQSGCELASPGNGSTVALKRVGSTNDWDIRGHLTPTTV